MKTLSEFGRWYITVGACPSITTYRSRLPEYYILFDGWLVYVALGQGSFALKILLDAFLSPMLVLHAALVI